MQPFILQILKRFAEAGLEFVVVGGVAVNLHGGTRMTYDIDLVPVLNETSWPKIIQILAGAEAKPRIPATMDQISDVANIRTWMRTKNLMALTFRSPDGQMDVDFLVSYSKDFEGLLLRSNKVKVDAITYNVASIDDLIAMKQAAGRPQDLLDIEELKSIKRRLKE